MRRAITSLLVLAAVAALTPASAVPSPVVATVQTRYVPGDDAAPLSLEVSQGSTLTYLNLDPTPSGSHTVTAYDVQPGDPTYFHSGVLEFGESAEVEGVPDLPVGSYPFYCTLHPAMRGTLVVE